MNNLKILNWHIAESIVRHGSNEVKGNFMKKRRFEAGKVTSRKEGGGA